MTQVAATRDPFVAALAGGSPPRAGAAAWLNERRAHALERANALAVPSPRDEEWRFTDIAPLAKLRLRLADGAVAVSAADAAPFAISEALARLVFIDGRFSPELSALPAEAGVVVLNLADALKHDGARLEPHLARLVSVENNLFAALNTAHLRDGAVVTIARDRSGAAPVHLLFIATRNEVAAHPRTLVLLEAGASCTVIEDYVALGAAGYLTNAVTEMVIGDHARLNHVRVQRESTAAFHIAACAVTVGRDAAYHAQAITLGARLSRYELKVVQEGEGAQLCVDGLALISGRQLADTHSVMDHAQPNGRSVQLHKTIVDGAAHAVFGGKILVRPGAQLTDSAQQSRNLILSERAIVDTKPQLEIFADDVKCAHGATVGQIDHEQLFYLKSRGLTEARARNLLVYAFGAEVIARIPVPTLVSRLQRQVLEQTRAEL